MLNNKYNTPSTDVNSAETKALNLLRESGFKTIQQLDWIGKKNGDEWTIIEVKEK